MAGERAEVDAAEEVEAEVKVEKEEAAPDEETWGEGRGTWMFRRWETTRRPLTASAAHVGEGENESRADDEEDADDSSAGDAGYGEGRLAFLRLRFECVIPREGTHSSSPSSSTHSESQLASSAAREQGEGRDAIEVAGVTRGDGLREREGAVEGGTDEKYVEGVDGGSVPEKELGENARV